LNFAHGNRVNPYTTIKLRKAETETLTKAVKIGTIPQSTQQPVAGEWNQQKIGQEVVKKAH
jgi:hypothetical protein